MFSRRFRGIVARLLSEFGSDIAHGVGVLRRSPGFGVVAAVSLALGIGVNTLIFSLLDSTLLQPLALPESDRLVTIWSSPANNREQRGPSSISRFTAIKQSSRSFEAVGAYNGGPCATKTLGSDERGSAAERIVGTSMSPSMFATLRVRPLVGRVFTEEEDLVDQVAPVMLLTYQTWERRFARDPQIVGKTLTMDRVPTTIIGVLPADFDFFGNNVEFVAPLCLTRAQVESRVGGNQIIGRLKPGVSAGQAQLELDGLIAPLAVEDPRRQADIVANVESLQRSRARLPSGDYGAALIILQGAVVFVLLIACANVGGLLIARTTSRRNELAVRIALGAPRGRVIRQLVTEQLPLSLLGALLGIGLAWGGLTLFARTAPPDFPRLDQLALDTRVLVFTLAVTMLTHVLFSIGPALQASKVPLVDPLKDSGRYATGGADRRRTRAVLVMGQVALALVLLVGAGLMIRSFVGVLRNNLGADPTSVLTFDFRFPARDAFKPAGLFRGKGLFAVSPVPALTVERVLERVKAVPGVVAVGASNLVPFSGATVTVPFQIEGKPLLSAPGTPSQQVADFYAVTRDFFSTMRIPVRRGREFTVRDTADRPFVMAINEAYARQYFPNEDPIGKFVRFDVLPEERPREIVGIVGDTVAGPLQGSLKPTVYVPHVQQTSQAAGPGVFLRIGMNFLVRTTTDPMKLVPSIRRAVAEVDAATPIAAINTVEQTLDSQIRHLQLYMFLLGLFGAVAVVLAGIGIYGVMAQSVTERTREIGVRMALGAGARQVLTLVIRQAAWLIGIGLLLGVTSAVALSRVVRSALFQISATDPVTYVAASVMLLLIAAIACLIPTRRAASVDPTVALRGK
jgi:putative ABC transport system permease protein